MPRKSKTPKTPRASRTADASTKRAAKPAKKIEAPKPALEAVETGGMGIDDGMVLTTTILLTCAVVLAYLVQYPS